MLPIYRLAILQSHPIQYYAPLFRRLAQEQDIDITVFYCSRQGVEEYYDEQFGQSIKWDVPLLEGYKSVFLPNRSQQSEIAGFTSMVNPSIIGQLRQSSFDAVLIHGHQYATELMAFSAAKILGIPVFTRNESHLLLQRSGFKKTFRRPLMTLFYRQLSRANLTIGSRNRDFYKFHGIGTHRLFHVPYVVDNEFFKNAVSQLHGQENSIKTKLGLPLDKTLILYASKLTKRKRPIDLLTAFKRIRAQNNDAALVFVGSGEEEEHLKEFARENNVPDVYFLGFRNQLELPSLYTIADFFVLPSENEPWGLIINEVMCAGLPVIATAEIGAVKDLVHHGRNGFVFPTGDIEKLSEHLQRLVTDAVLRQQMGQQSLEIIADWDLEVCVRGVKAALQSLPDQNRKTSQKSQLKEISNR